jgi:hypothetical protein
VAQPGKNPLPALSFVAGAGFVSFTADADTAEGPQHLNFRLASGKEWIGLYDAALKPIDRIVHFDQTTDVAQGRSPDGAASPYQFLALPTPGLANTAAQALIDLTNGLRITELMYNPLGDGDLEFIEVQNVGSVALDLTGVRLSGAVSFSFPAMLLAPGQYAVVARNVGKFAERYGAGVNVVGQYGGKLSDGGDDLVLELPAPLDTAILRFAYNDTWYPTTDGGGYALTIRNPLAAAATWDAAASWQAGGVVGGSPGRADAGTIVPDIVINEVLTHTDEPLVDAIELYNRGAAAVDISGWYLSDDAGTLKKFRIPNGTALAAGGYAVFRQAHWTNHVMEFAANEFGGANPVGFALNSYRGDQVWLAAADASGNVTRVVDCVEFGAMANGESLGRWPNGSGNLYPLRNRTLDAPNNDNAAGGNGPRVGPVVITEVMYRPVALSTAELNAGFTSVEQMEYVEIFNPTAAAITLTHWQLGKGVDFNFAAGATLPAGGVMVVAGFDPSNAAMLQAFRTRYGMSAGAAVVGAFSGSLSDLGEKVQLQDFDQPPLEDPTLWPALIEDEVVYAASWGGNGDGLALRRLAAGGWGNDAANWTAAAPTPGRFDAVAGAPRVTGIYVRGSAWDQTFFNALAAAGVGNATLGYRLADGANQLANSRLVNWSNVNRIVVAFSEPVSLGQSSLTLYNSLNQAVATSGFAMLDGMTAEWTLPAALAANKYWINLAAATIADGGGNALDGEWTTSTTTYATSGNGAAGGDCQFRFNVLPGDANTSGVVNSTDVASVRSKGLVAADATNYRQDLNGSGAINSTDVAAVRAAGLVSIVSYSEPLLPPPAPPEPSLSPLLALAAPQFAAPADARADTPVLGTVISVALVGADAPNAPTVSLVGRADGRQRGAAALVGEARRTSADAERAALNATLPATSFAPLDRPAASERPADRFFAALGSHSQFAPFVRRAEPDAAARLSSESLPQRAHDRLADRFVADEVFADWDGPFGSWAPGRKLRAGSSR